MVILYFLSFLHNVKDINVLKLCFTYKLQSCYAHDGRARIVA